MIDFWGVLFNFLWILGLAVILAVLSYASYEAAIATRIAKQRLRDKLDEFAYALALDVGLVLFCAGLAATEDRWWARLLWIGLGIVWIIEGAWRIRWKYFPR
jgi:hypothetical protein